MTISLVTPAAPDSHNGNRATAERWARRFAELGHEVHLSQAWTGETVDILVALHATRSYPSIERFHRERPNTPIVVALTGTDLYVDLPDSWEAMRSIQLATRLITLQPLAVEVVPAPFREKVCVIYQSAEAVTRVTSSPSDGFRVCVLAHLRPVKDPLRAATAARELPMDSKVSVVHAGAPLDPNLAEQARIEHETNPRYRWLGDLPPAAARRVLADSHLLAVTSRSEGGANVVTEAIATGVPVISSRIDGSIGLLGPDYPGYFPVANTAALAALFVRTERDAGFLEELRARCHTLQWLTGAARERQSWREILEELGLDRGSRTTADSVGDLGSPIR